MYKNQSWLHGPNYVIKLWSWKTTGYSVLYKVALWVNLVDQSGCKTHKLVIGVLCDDCGQTVYCNPAPVYCR